MPKPLSIEDRARLDDLFEQLSETSRHTVGYPCNQDWDYSELFRFLQFPFNNIGDPYEGSNFPLNTHQFECEVLGEFADFTRADKEDFWGYLTTGGTEGNMYGLYLAREIFPEGIVYFSEDTHYSVAKILRLQHTRNIMIKSQKNGEIDYDDLRESIRLNRDAPPIIFANIGTTMKGAIDDLAKIREIMQGFAIRDYYIHCDAALSGMILPFLNNPPPWTFADGADSISISGHKMIGSPLPYGIALARKRYVERISRSVEYVGVRDTTITGSRSAFAPLILWYALRTLGRDGLEQNARYSLDLARYAVERFQENGVDAWRNLNSVTVVFPTPGRKLMNKWIVAPDRGIGHLIALPHMTKSLIDTFISDYCEDRASKGRDKVVHHQTKGMLPEETAPSANILPDTMRQITIITENQSGEFAEITNLLADLNINIEDIEVSKDQEHGVIILSVDQYDAALQAIHDAGFQAVSQDALVIRLEDKPGALGKIATRFQEQAIKLRSMHIIRRRKGRAHVSIVTTDNERAAELLKDVLVGQ